MLLLSLQMHYILCNHSFLSFFLSDFLCFLLSLSWDLQGNWAAVVVVVVVVVVVDLGLTTLLSQVISVAFYSEREKSEHFCSEALISAWRSFTCRTWRHGTYDFISLPKEVIPKIFTLWKNPSTTAVFDPANLGSICGTTGVDHRERDSIWGYTECSGIPITNFQGL